jgi:hypothetical protein
MIKALLLIGLFNVHSGTVHDVTVLKAYTDWQACSKALIATGTQYPDKNGDVPIFECVVPGDRTTMGLAKSS